MKIHTRCDSKHEDVFVLLKCAHANGVFHVQYVSTDNVKKQHSFYMRHFIQAYVMLNPDLCDEQLLLEGTVSHFMKRSSA